MLSKSKISLDRREGEWMKICGSPSFDAAHLFPEGVRCLEQEANQSLRIREGDELAKESLFDAI